MRESDHLDFACQCGAVAGRIEQVSPKNGDYVVCHCSDCQDLARYLGQSETVLDAHGGSHLYQSRCAQMTIEQGADRLRSLHLTDKGTLRWFAECCKTPLFNTYANGKVPYVTTQLAACEPSEVRQMLGAPLGHLFLDDAPIDASHLRELSLARLMRRFFVRMIKDVFGRQRRKSALFDSQTLEPISPPHRLTTDERTALWELRP